MKKITPFLWFDDQAEEAMNFYVSIFKNSKILNVSPGPNGKAFTVSFELDGQEFTALNAGPEFKFTEAVSFSVNCQDQQEVDELWGKLTADSGEVVAVMRETGHALPSLYRETSTGGLAAAYRRRKPRQV